MQVASQQPLVFTRMTAIMAIRVWHATIANTQAGRWVAIYLRLADAMHPSCRGPVTITIDSVDHSSLGVPHDAEATGKVAQGVRVGLVYNG